MINLLRSEWIKFRSVRSTLVVLALAGALVVLVSLLSANSANNEADKAPEGYSCVDDGSAATPSPTASETTTPNRFCPDGGTPVRETERTTNLTDLTVGVTIATLLFGVLGVQVIGQEYRFNTIRPTFTAVPHRYKVVAAKLVVATTSCAVVAAVMVGFCWLVGTVMVENFEVDGVDQRAALGIVLFSMLFAALGLGFGAILRQPIAAIPLLLGEAFVAEGIIGALVESTVKWLPFSNGFQMTLRNDSGGGDGFGELQSVLGGGLYFFAVVAVVVGIGAYLVDKRDA